MIYNQSKQTNTHTNNKPESDPCPLPFSLGLSDQFVVSLSAYYPIAKISLLLL